MDTLDPSQDTPTSNNPITKALYSCKRFYQVNLDNFTPYKLYRWLTLGVLTVLFFIRVIYCQGWYVVCYSYGIFMLNQFLLFLTPKFDVSLRNDEQNDELEAGGNLASNDEEFRPFIRRLPEFKFWYNGFRGILLSLFLSIFPIFDIPVFWPILLMYFILLFIFTMRRQIHHMIKYKYVPLDIGKKKYNLKANSAK
ncbi:probable Protein RER1 [Saccharomycodes ludwigii]|uniref:Protein RER1 n=1 Tax=Saccharomycodes ludwigii TaxID=36035 RepID=A0A376BCF1_9ASCO|nr:hypothetical protein SCDLUD_003432 [Saccharomycodes ludwigii]KAH3900450.1 hypothetical protein SCDLUD_003432 [Saccharomycodes ludwigii]SSD61810.1 probable Protein RER1 [Saccharomycodes ludwigii]